MYAGDHKEVYPPGFWALSGYGHKLSWLFICPSSGHYPGIISNVHEWTDYVYIANLNDADPVEFPVVFCPPQNHRDEGGNVLFMDAHVEWLETDAFVKLINLSGFPDEIRDRAKILRATKQIKKKPRKAVLGS